MGGKDPRTMWIEPFFDVSQPYLYVLVLPPLVLFALGLRRTALMYFLDAASVLVFVSVG